MLGTKAGPEIRLTLGYAMVGGLLLSHALTLYTTPVIYRYLDRLQRALSPAPRGVRLRGCRNGWGRHLKKQPGGVGRPRTPAIFRSVRRRFNKNITTP